MFETSPVAPAVPFKQRRVGEPAGGKTASSDSAHFGHPTNVCPTKSENCPQNPTGRNGSFFLFILPTVRPWPSDPYILGKGFGGFIMILAEVIAVLFLLLVLSGAGLYWIVAVGVTARTIRLRLKQLEREGRTVQMPEVGMFLPWRLW
jgi:hypothetical protein